MPAFQEPFAATKDCFTYVRTIKKHLAGLHFSFCRVRIRLEMGYYY